MSADLSGLTFLDRPNSYIGRSVPRPNARRLLEGRGVYVDDVAVARLGHVAFLRSPHATPASSRWTPRTPRRCPA